MLPIESREIGMSAPLTSSLERHAQLITAAGFWLPLLARTVAKVTGVTDYNIVQNNGARAAQVVPHVHFHIIPRPGSLPELKNKSWTMFGRGQREDLDDDEGKKLAKEMRDVLSREVERVGKEARL
jgi:diadenosine tetraphosphate (Ap4A) HIT family hydrolase